MTGPRTDSGPRGRLARAALWAAVIYLPALALLGMLAWVTARMGIPFGSLSRDSSVVTETEFYPGALSNLGAMIWCAGATACLLCFVITRGYVEPAWSRFFLAWGLLTTLLTADDLFMLHDGLIPVLTGWPEFVLLGTHGTFALVCLLVSASVLPRTPLWLLFAAAAFFMISLALDVGLLGIAEHRRHLAEDGCKFLGIVSWTGYLIASCVRVARNAPAIAASSPATSAPVFAETA